MNMNWHDFMTPVMSYFRRNRMVYFIKLFPDLESLTVLDVGGRPMIWDLIYTEFGIKPNRLVLYNNESEVADFDEYECEIGDGTNMDYPSKYFDLVFSNSVIEHVGDMEKRRRFASECERVGRNIYIQTPNRWFPIEPHIVTLFIHWLPKRIYKTLSFFSLRYFTMKNSKFIEIIDETHLISKSDLVKLFPDKYITHERLLMLTKSLIVSNRR